MGALSSVPDSDLLCYGPDVEVSDTTAMVLLELYIDTLVSCVAHAELDNVPASKTCQQVRAMQPGVFKLKGLVPGKNYMLSFAAFNPKLNGWVEICPPMKLKTRLKLLEADWLHKPVCVRS